MLWLVQTVHFWPCTPGLHTHLPVICSQSSRTEPKVEQPQANNIIRISAFRFRLDKWKRLTDATVMARGDFWQAPISRFASITFGTTYARSAPTLLCFRIARVGVRPEFVASAKRRTSSVTRTLSGSLPVRTATVPSILATLLFHETLI